MTRKTFLGIGKYLLLPSSGSVTWSPLRHSFSSRCRTVFFVSAVRHGNPYHMSFNTNTVREEVLSYVRCVGNKIGIICVDEYD